MTDTIVRPEGLRVARFSGALRAAGSNFRVQDGPAGPEGVADVMVAVFGIPDTAPAVGNVQRQIIDPGSFRGWIDRVDWSLATVAFMRDHGNAHIFGYVDSSLILGYGTAFREGQATVREQALTGLIFEPHWNLATDEGRNAFERARFDPFGTEFSFRWSEDEIYKGKDGFEHVRTFSDVVEVSQVGFGAQAAAGVLEGTLRAGVRAMVRETIEEQAFAAAVDRQRRLGLERRSGVVVDGTKGFVSLPTGEVAVVGLEVAEGGDRHKYHGDKVPPKPTKGVLSEWLKDDAFRDMVKGMVKGAGAWSMSAFGHAVDNTIERTAGGDLSARAYSVDGFSGRLAAAIEAEVGSDSCWCYAAEVFVESPDLTAGWVIVGLRGQLVVQEGAPGDPGSYQAFGSSDEWVMLRVPWVGSEPDENGVPSLFSFDIAGAFEVDRAWVAAGTPVRGAALLRLAWTELVEGDAPIAPLPGTDEDVELDWYARAFASAGA